MGTSKGSGASCSIIEKINEESLEEKKKQRNKILKNVPPRCG